MPHFNHPEQSVALNRSMPNNGRAVALPRPCRKTTKIDKDDRHPHRLIMPRLVQPDTLLPCKRLQYAA
jgi:hypothetical protein